MPFDSHLEEGARKYLRADYKTPFFEFQPQIIKILATSESVAALDYVEF
jgi:hypothetical protein